MVYRYFCEITNADYVIVALPLDPLHKSSILYVKSNQKIITLYEKTSNILKVWNHKDKYVLF